MLNKIQRSPGQRKRKVQNHHGYNENDSFPKTSKYSAKRNSKPNYLCQRARSNGVKELDLDFRVPLKKMKCIEF